MSEESSRTAKGTGLNAEPVGDSGDEEPIEAQGPSEIAARIQSLKSSVLHAAATRERLPQVLFWSLFHTEIKSIKRRKERKRLLDALS